MRAVFVLLFAFPVCAAALAAEQASDKAPGCRLEPNTPAAIKALADKPVTTQPGPAGDLLRKWYAEKSAAGNVGDVYDNRDRGHSGLDLSQFPQLSKTVYNELALKHRLDWAATLRRLPLPTFGNSSTSAGVPDGGSNPRMMYTAPGGLRGLYAQYTANNLYIYPEHCDYKPGHNGSPGYGDLYPTNTPFVFISQGSSGSDQPFMHAVPMTMAAFRPEVKKKLVQHGLLMPTVQMIFRSTDKQLSGPGDYLTGKAHPPVFDGAWVDPLAMIRMAHEMTADTIPPMAQLTVVEEDSPVRGSDYFEAEGRTEELGTTPAVIARVVRGRSFSRRMLVSAANSFDRNRRPLEFHWVLLRGDPQKVSIKPLTGRHVAAEIVVNWHDRRPIAAGSPMESSRVDIGVFVHNGKYYSAPAFITFFFLDSEARTFDPKGRLLEIGYGSGEVDVQAPWLLSVPLRSMLADPYLFRKSGSVAAQVLRTPAQKTAFRNLSQRFVHWGLFREAADSPEKLVLTPLRKAADTDPAALTRFEKDLLQRFHGEWLGQFVYRNVAGFPFRAYYVDPNISPRKSWRDVYHYNAQENCTGWTRYDDDRAAEFTADGKLVLEKDAAGKPSKTQAVRYEQEQPKFDPANPPRGPNWNFLRWKAQE